MSVPVNQNNMLDVAQTPSLSAAASEDKFKLEDGQHEVTPGHPLHNDELPREVSLDDQAPAERLSTRTFLAIGFLGLSVTGPISCGQLMIGAILSSVVGQLEGDPSNAGWVISGWATASAVSFSIAGRASDIYGRRWIMLIGNLCGIVGAIVAATAHTLTSLIAGEVLLGFAAGLVLVAFAAVPELIPYKYRGLGMAWIEFCLFAPWGAFAALLANLLLQHASWRWCFWIALIYSGLSLIGTAFFYFPPVGRKLGSRSKLQATLELDYGAMTLFAGGLVSVSIGLSWGGTSAHPWRSASVIAPTVIGLLALITAFTYDFLYISPDRALFPRTLFKMWREFTVVLVCSFVAGCVYYTNAGLLPEATFYIFSNDPTTIGILLLPNGIGQWFGATVVPGLLHLHKSTRYPIILAVLLQTLFVGLYAYALPDHKGAWSAFQFFGQGCFDWITTLAVVNISLHVLHSDLGVAIGLLGTFRSFGGTIGNAVFRAILSSSLNDNLVPKLVQVANSFNYPSASIPGFIGAAQAAAVGVPDAYTKLPTVSSALQAAAALSIRETYTTAFRLVFYSMIPFGIISLICSLFIRDTRQMMTSHVSVKLKGQ